MKASLCTQAWIAFIAGLCVAAQGWGAIVHQTINWSIPYTQTDPPPAYSIDQAPGNLPAEICFMNRVFPYGDRGEHQWNVYAIFSYRNASMEFTVTDIDAFGHNHDLLNPNETFTPQTMWICQLPQGASIDEHSLMFAGSRRWEMLNPLFGFDENPLGYNGYPDPSKGSALGNFGCWINDVGFVGFRIHTYEEEVGYNHYYYGWVRIELDKSTHGYYVNDLAFENTPDTPIIAGAVPEPAALSMLVLGGLALLRRKVS